MARRIKKASIKFLSLVPRGANRLPVIYKSDDETIDMDLLVKADAAFEERGEMLAVVYSPEHRDSQGDIASAEVIKDACYGAAQNGLNLDIRHNEKPIAKDKAFVAESFIVQKGDARFSDFKDYGGNKVDVTGAWGVVLKIEDPALRKEYREGKWNGISMGGVASVEVEKAAPDHARMLLDALATKLKLHNTSIYGSVNMTGQELCDALAAQTASITKALEASNASLVKALKGEPTTEPKKETPAAATDAPVFKGEATVENLKKHRQALQRHTIISGIDWTNAESVTKGETALAELEKSMKPATEGAELTAEEKWAGIAKEDTAEVRTLKLSLAKAQKRSNQPAETETAGVVGMSKEDSDLMAVGRKIAQAANSRGIHKTSK